MGKQADTTAVTIDRATLVAVVERIGAIDASLATLRGTQGERLKAARLAVLGVTLDGNLPEFPSVTLYEGVDRVEHLVKLVETVDQWRAEVDKYGDDLAALYLAGHKSASDDQTATLKEERAALVEQGKALLTILPTLGVNVDGIEIPKRSAGGRPAGVSNPVSGRQFFVHFDGESEARLMASSQNKLSSIAWYHGVRLTKGNEATPEACRAEGSNTTGVLRTVAEAAGVDVTSSEPWTVFVEGVGSFGMMVPGLVETDTTDEEATDEG